MYLAPPMARSGLPPPLPPSWVERSLTSLPACQPFWMASGLQRARVVILSSWVEVRMMMEGGRFWERVRARPRRSLGLARSVWAMSQWSPLCCSASFRRSSVWEAADFCWSLRRDFSSSCFWDRRVSRRGRSSSGLQESLVVSWWRRWDWDSIRL